MQKCQFCRGTGGVKTPDGSLYQCCPLCGGTGVQQNTGIPFWLNIEFSAALGNVVGANAQATQTVRVNNHSFLVRFLVAVSTGAFTAQLYSGDTQQALSTGSTVGGAIASQVHSANMFGTAQNPMVLPPGAELIFPKGTGVRLDVTDLTGANNTIRVSLIGVQLND